MLCYSSNANANYLTTFSLLKRGREISLGTRRTYTNAFFNYYKKCEQGYIICLSFYIIIMIYLFSPQQDHTVELPCINYMIVEISIQSIYYMVICREIYQWFKWNARGHGCVDESLHIRADVMFECCMFPNLFAFITFALHQNQIEPDLSHLLSLRPLIKPGLY